MASNEQYVVSARKYRPGTFQSVVGQRALTATLKNAILGGKLAQAYLFCGPRGVGKTSCARIFAKTINCMNPTPDGEACGECESCKAIEKGNSFNLMELDAASNNSVDNIRNITEQVNIPAQDGRYRVFIIDEVHMLSNNAFNAFLKTLEEPPKNVVFILATTERHKVIPTIMSRCQVYDFRRITVNDIVDHLQYVAESEGVEAEREALGVIAEKADGAMRDALSIFDQVVASTHGKVTYQGVLDALNVLDQDYYFRLIDIFKQGDVPSALLTLKEITDKGFDAQFFINGLADHVRNLMVCADPRSVVLLETSEEMAKKYTAQSPGLPVEWYYAAMKILNDTDFNYRTSGNKKLLVELALIRLSRLLSPPATPPFGQPDGEKPQPVPASLSEASSKAEKKVAEEPASSLKPEPNKTYPPVKEDSQKEENKKPEAKRISTGGRPSSFRLSDTETDSKPRNVNSPRNKPFTKEAFMELWLKFADENPEQRILVSAMRGARIEETAPAKYKIGIDHPAQKQAFESNFNTLLDYLKNGLENDGLEIQVEVAEEEPSERKLNPKEFLKLAVEENEMLAKFLKDIDAELE